MLKGYAVAGLAGVLTGALTAYCLRPGGSIVESTESTAREEPPSRARITPTPAERERPEPLSECRQMLFRREVELRGAQAAAARALAAGRPGPGVPSPMMFSAEAMEPEDEVPGPMDEAERQRYREASVKVRDAVIEHFHITEEEEHTLSDLFCPGRDNERSLFSDYADGRIDAQTFFNRFAQERATSNEGLRRSLGAGRFRRLQRAGALWILSSRLCKKR